MSGVIFRIIPDITDDWSIYDTATQDTPTSWEPVFEKADDELKLVSEVITNKERLCGKVSYPPRSLVFEAFRRVRLEDVKVVIVGQDPYYNGTAVGLAFSMKRERRASPSLKNIYKEIRRTHPEFTPPDHGDVSEWCNQGVLLLNRALTVQPDKPKSHVGEWSGFTRRVVEAICEHNPHAVFMMWGADAKKVEEFMTGRPLKLMSGHPSPQNRKRDFYGNDHFKLANEHLKKKGFEPIDWQLSS